MPEIDRAKYVLHWIDSIVPGPNLDLKTMMRVMEDAPVCLSFSLFIGVMSFVFVDIFPVCSFALVSWCYWLLLVLYEFIDLDLPAFPVLCPCFLLLVLSVSSFIVFLLFSLLICLLLLLCLLLNLNLPCSSVSYC